MSQYVITFNKQFFQGVYPRCLVVGERYVACEAINIGNWPNYKLVLKPLTEQVCGVYERMYITGFSDGRCGHYEFTRLDGSPLTVSDVYSGERAFCPTTPLYNLVIPRKNNTDYNGSLFISRRNFNNFLELLIALRPIAGNGANGTTQIPLYSVITILVFSMSDILTYIKLNGFDIHVFCRNLLEQFVFRQSYLI